MHSGRPGPVLEGDLDLRGFFSVSKGVRPGFTQIRGEVRFDSPASEEELSRLKREVDAHCPVLDLFLNPTPVDLRVVSSEQTAGGTRQVA